MYPYKNTIKVLFLMLKLKDDKLLYFFPQVVGNLNLTKDVFM